MKTITLRHHRGIAFLLAVYFAGILSLSANAIPSFQSSDWRQPNPARPYEMTSGTVGYGESQFSLYDLTIQIANQSQLDTPSHGSDNSRLEFDSTFDVNFQAIVSRALEPPHQEIGSGTARIVRITRPDNNPPHTYPHPQVFDTELVSMTLNFFDTSPALPMILRESPTLDSRGITIREDPMPNVRRAIQPLDHIQLSERLHRVHARRRSYLTRRERSDSP